MPDDGFASVGNGGYVLQWLIRHWSTLPAHAGGLPIWAILIAAAPIADQINVASGAFKNGTAYTNP